MGRVAGCPGLQLPLPGVWGTSCRSLPGPHPSFPLESFLPREGCPGPLGVDKETMVLDEPPPTDQLRRSRAPTPASLLLLGVQLEA